ncbi:putative aryl-alcohol dehydrogenase aad14 [Stygiomarasmius scandens]|uniref:Aryl-alcohol dehydrogenase aad14 n=1 Tax=Marasmiellus scandens TaxID=2682957 RepID=A0ABR1JB71_9AGAR
MSFSSAAPAPPTPLGLYRALSKNASIHVSPLVLGGMSIGDAWEAVGMGKMNKETSFQLLDAFFEAGGNFIDTANSYQNETSEAFIGEWMETRGIRDQIVVATKYSFNYKIVDSSIKNKVNYHGNNHKSMLLSLEASLKKLRTNYIDLFYVHVWDYETSIEEVMNNLHALVESRKVLYLGISDTPAWVVAQANQYARDHGKTPFSVYQGSWNVMDRALEREILPMARQWGMAICPWNVLCSGKLRSDAEEERREKSGELGRDLKIDDNGWKRTEHEKKMATALEIVAKEFGIDTVPPIAIAYLMHKAPYVFPVLGGRKVEQLKDNIQALTISLTPEQMEFIDSQMPFDVGFPHNIINDGSQPNFMFNTVCQTARVPYQSPIAHKKSI